MNKLFISLILIISCSINANELIPERLLKAIDSFTNDPNLYPIYRVDLLVFSNQLLIKDDNEEQFPELEDFNFSDDLIQLLAYPTFLVRKESIDKALIPNKQVIKLIDIKKKDLSEEKDIKQLNELQTSEINGPSVNKTLHLPYEYYELLDKEDAPINKLVNKLELQEEYSVIFSGSWYQPIFNEDLASPVYISKQNNLEGVHGELVLFKERYLHSNISLRLAKETNKQVKDNSELILYNFNKLLKVSKANNRFIKFFKSINNYDNFFNNFLLRSKVFSPIENEKVHDSSSLKTFEDKFELKQKTKMKENMFYYIDHPYFGAVLKVSLWNQE